LKEFGERENMLATFSSQDLPETWPPEAAIAIYRIAQEALRNVSKHAGKTHVKMILSGSNAGLQLRMMDFGLGFDQETDVPTPGLGMISMQERARLAGGTTKVQSALGHGTTVIVYSPRSALRKTYQQRLAPAPDFLNSLLFFRCLRTVS
jgi:two-component system, chemotaxis family, CheB/CheR fusion protein